MHQDIIGVFPSPQRLKPILAVKFNKGDAFDELPIYSFIKGIGL
jgi:hypothetical protein